MQVQDSFDEDPRLSAVQRDDDAFELARALMQRQLLQRGETTSRGAQKGDSRFRTLFLTILKASDQRRFFLGSLRSEQHAGRIVHLFGAPPYPFLLPTDAALLRAAGIAPSRKRMALEPAAHSADVQAQVPSTANFGAPHFRDQEDRQFKVFTHSAQAAPRAGDAAAAEFFVRRSMRGDRVSLVCKSEPGAFPRAGAQLTLTTSGPIQKMRAMASLQAARVRVQSVALRSRTAATALLEARIESITAA